MIYLDNAATTLPKPSSVGAAMLQALSTCGNAGRGGHEAAMAGADTLFRCRENAAELFGLENPEQVVFTQNATHALNIALHGMLHRGGHCVVSGFEHNSVMRPLYAMRENRVRYSVARAPLFDPEAFLKAFESAIEPDTVCAVCTHVSNVFGYILPITEVDRICARYGIPLILDAAQSAGALSISMNQFSAVKFICMPGHKGLYGPQGTGLLLCEDGGEIPALMQGGTGSRSSHFAQPSFLPDRHESGTQNIHGIAGLNAGITYVREQGETKIFEREHALISYAIACLSHIEGLKLYAAEWRDCQAGVLAFESERYTPEEMTELLGENDIAVRGGLHCAPLAHETVGTNGGCVRVSVSDFNKQSDLEALADTLMNIL